MIPTAVQYHKEKSRHLTPLILVNDVIQKNFLTDLSGVCIIGAQHLLKTTHQMLDLLSHLGLNADNVFLIGKCYSTNQRVMKEMESAGFHISKDSTKFEFDRAFDETYCDSIRRFYKRVVIEVNRRNPQKIIILDDGGEFLSFFNPNDFECKKVVGIEQTTSGCRRLMEHNLPIQVINVARSWAKLNYESPLISKFSSDKLLSRLSSNWQQKDRLLIIGGGAIGGAIYDRLLGQVHTDIIDKNPNLSTCYFDSIEKTLPLYNFIIGCTGGISVPHSQHRFLRSGTMLISASSSDREFDAYYFRRGGPKQGTCHKDLWANEICLINNGFPVNFDGGAHSVPARYIQLTRALLTAAIFQGINSHQHTKGLVPLSFKAQKHIVHMFTNEILSESEMKMFYGICDTEHINYA